MTTETVQENLVAEIDCAANTLTYRPMTADELAARERLQIEFLEQEAKRESAVADRAALRESAKAKLIAGEPLTEEEAAVIVL
jgi:hypothetical protein